MARQHDDKPPPSAYDRALGLLARREHSERELKRKLVGRGFDKDASGAALDKLKEQHYQSDERFAESLLRQRIGAGYGPHRIMVELRSHGVADARIRSLLAEAAADWGKLAQDLLQRRYGAASAVAVERAKRAQFLLRRGFDAATVRAVTQVTGSVTDAADEFD